MVTQGKPTVLLAVNTPLTTSTGESENFENFPMISNSTNAFVDRIQQAVDSGVNVSVCLLYTSVNYTIQLYMSI